MGCSYYNGTILPNLPSYDATRYPYALIICGEDSDGVAQYALLLCSQPFRAGFDTANAFVIESEAEYIAYKANLDTYAWLQVQFDIGDSDGVSGKFVWSNHDICLGHIYPDEMPEWDSASYPYLLMLRRSIAGSVESAGTYIPTYEAWYSAEPFVLDDAISTEGQALTEGELGVIGPTFRYSDTAVKIGHMKRVVIGVSDANWSSLADEPITTDRIIGNAAFDPVNPAFNANYWANHDMVGAIRGYELKANSWYELNCYSDTEPVDVPVPLPIDAAITGGNATYGQNCATADVMVCAAGTPEGGSLSYQWYRYADDESEENAVKCSGGNRETYIPDTRTLGVWHYFCEVTNSQYGGKATVRTGSVSITINAAEEPAVSVVRKPVEVMGYVLRLCGVPMAELIATAICKGATAETEPESDYYIFGTPSENGKIGLRVGDTITYYKGAVLPALPKWDKDFYPYAVIEYHTTTVNDETAEVVTLLVMEEPVPYSSSVINRGIKGDCRSAIYHIGYKSVDEPAVEEWWFGKAETSTSLSWSSYIWANYPLMDSYKGVLHLDKSDPIPVGDIVEYINDIPIYEVIT